MTTEKFTVVQAVGSRGYYRLELVAERVGLSATRIRASPGPGEGRLKPLSVSGADGSAICQLEPVNPIRHLSFATRPRGATFRGQPGYRLLPFERSFE